MRGFGWICGLVAVAICWLTIGSNWDVVLIAAATSWGVTLLYPFGDDPPSRRHAWSVRRRRGPARAYVPAAR